jgi:hypothetical protein
MSASGPTVLPDPERFQTVRHIKRTATSNPPAEIAAASMVKLPRLPRSVVSNFFALACLYKI